ncbi:MAG: tetratricopeptide repeat protein [Candidatus Omnitrophica bacterium]|nr:tetratricopeptide repeat protein [Candidatus Omnitrophota bacterium]
MKKINDKKNKIKKSLLCIVFLSSIFYLLPSLCYGQDSGKFVSKSWSALGQRNFDKVYQLTDECIQTFTTKAKKQASKLNDFPAKGEEANYKVMNDVATCYFIKAESYMREEKKEKAIETFQEVIEKYPYAQSFDPRGWYWSIQEKAKSSIEKLKTGKIGKEESKEEVVITQVKLYDPGKKLPIDYEKFGEFKGAGTKNYEYIIKKPIELAEAVGEGIFPNTNSVKFDPRYQEIKNKLYKIDHWKVLNSRNLNAAFYKWIKTPEPAGIRQFHIGEILEKSGLIEHAVKAYYAVIVHFPETYGWTYWHTPWYVGNAALYRIKYLLQNHPELGLRLEDAEITIINGFDNNIRNDSFIVNPGKITKKPFWEKLFSKDGCAKKKRKLGKVIKESGKKVKLVQYQNGDWQLKVNGKPFILKAVTYDPTRVGESPDEGTMENWTVQDINNNDLIDAPYEAWVDKNNNNQKDKGEKKVGDFQLMADMGVNAIRLYHQPFERNKKIIRQMYEKYGIYTLIGDFLGKYTLGSGAKWEDGTDYENPADQENMLKSVKKMVTTWRDEDAILFWVLGNENVYGLGCNADKKPDSFFKFANRAAKLIKKLDPKKRPVAIASGDTLYLDLFAKNCPDIDIFGTNSYRGKYGFLGLFEDVKRISGKPAIITEYGAPSYAKGYSQEEAQDYQAQYHQGCWNDIICNSAGYGAGNVLGAVAYEWIDEWWKAYEPTYHDKEGLFSGPFLDGYMHEEWLGLISQGDGSKSPFLRQPKKSYFKYKKLWN